ncbi:alpha/beta hydrolase family protein [Pseudonocardia nigra]|uniref:alpha/beta hydrolase family protein n=1 Tax=Pseudonocardia nigra TaxID=1921578 RepID=UPI0027E21EBA|nr:alpha/beta fold hydrolase [Pseudonocardia nigra]
MEAEDTTGAAQVTPTVIRASSMDWVPLAGVHLPGPDADTALAVCHGFTHHTRHPSTRRVLTALAAHAPVVAFDMRGHGRSGGRSTVGDREVLDLDAAVAWARAAGYPRVVTVGFSLGAAVALRQAAAGTARPDAVVAVSPPARWYSRETVPMRRVHWLLEQPHGRLAARLLGVRLAGPWTTVPPSPVEVVGDIAPTPLLLVHFTGDPYFSSGHAWALAAASGGRAQLWTEPGTGHGESGTDAALAERITRWARDAAGARPADGSADRGSTVRGHIPAERRGAGSEVG